MTQEADKLFEEMGYKKAYTLDYLLYKKRYTNIQFFLNRKSFIKNGLFDGDYEINMGELKAIYIKCKEMGWV